MIKYKSRSNNWVIQVLASEESFRILISGCPAIAYDSYNNFFWLYNGEIKKVIWPVGGLFFAKIPKLSDGKSYNGP